jgi:hypothetical protein
VSLPKGQYPIFNYYPKFVVDQQLRERERAEAEEQQLAQRQSVLHELQQRSQKLVEEQEAWTQRQEALLKVRTTDGDGDGFLPLAFGKHLKSVFVCVCVICVMCNLCNV